MINEKMTNEQFALLEVLRRAILALRIEGQRGKENGISVEGSNFIADLADAIHNIPDALMSDDFDLYFHTNTMLGPFEDTYANHDCIKPLSLYRDTLHKSRQRQQS